RIISAQVTVTRPDLDAGNLTVNGITRTNGAVTMMRMHRLGTIRTDTRFIAQSDGLLIAQLYAGNPGVCEVVTSYDAQEVSSSNRTVVGPVMKGVPISFKWSQPGAAGATLYYFGHAIDKPAPE
ncbi:hypothetical protein, partial [Kitasatospora sp. MBT63]|uniref:hypothetical protein n=1 Tax=Kitasatospora sp. MBT63 TaxID=1444768 RepID=UPI000539BE0B